MQLNGTTVDMSIKSRDLMRVRDDGHDIGDLTNDILTGVTINLIQALDMSWMIYAPRLIGSGITDRDSYLDAVDSSGVEKFVEEFRKSLAVFFPVMEAIQAEYQQAMSSLEQE